MAALASIPSQGLSVILSSQYCTSIQTGGNGAQGMHNRSTGRSKLLSPDRKHPARSKTAAFITALGLVIFRVAMAAAVLFLVGGACFAIFAQEPLWSRLLTFVALGLLPALFTYTCGWPVYLMMAAVGAVYDPMAKRMQALSIRVTVAVLAITRMIAGALIRVDALFQTRPHELPGYTRSLSSGLATALARGRNWVDIQRRSGLQISGALLGRRTQMARQS